MFLKSLRGNKNQTAVLVAIGLAASFALMGVWVRMMDDSFETFQQTYLRILIAGLLAVVIFRKKISKNFLSSISKREWSVYGIRALVSYTVGVASFTVAIQHANLATVSFIAALPILGLLAWILFREKLPVKSLLPIGLSIIGLALVTGIDFSNFSFGIGEWAALICLLGFDIGFLMSRMHNKARSNFENTTILLLIGWIPVFMISMVKHEALLPDSVSAVAFTGLLFASLANIVGLYAINYVFTNLKAYVAGNILLLECVFALILGLVLYGEPITLGIVLGGLLIAASAIAVNNINKADQEALTPLLDEAASKRPNKARSR
jgi:drug/metabolite transporter (DMT)-like permease